MKRKIFAFALTAALVSALSLPAVSVSAADTAAALVPPAIGENQTHAGQRPVLRRDQRNHP